MTIAPRSSPSALRNREPILEVLARFVPANARVLEIACGTGEHATFLAPRLAVASWQPTDPSTDALASVNGWREQLGTKEVRPALPLDVHSTPWPVEDGDSGTRFDMLYCANMIHIAPWTVCVALFEGAARVVKDGGLVALYGPYKREGNHTAPSNEAFDAHLRSEDPEWGVRDLEAVRDLAAKNGFALREVVAMPANNFTLIFARTN